MLRMFVVACAVSAVGVPFSNTNEPSVPVIGVNSAGMCACSFVMVVTKERAHDAAALIPWAGPSLARRSGASQLLSVRIVAVGDAPASLDRQDDRLQRTPDGEPEDAIFVHVIVYPPASAIRPVAIPGRGWDRTAAAAPTAAAPRRVRLP